MKKFESVKFFRCGQWNGIEESVCLSILRQHGFDVIDIENELRHLPDAELHEFMNDALKGTESYFLPSVPLERMQGQPYLHFATRLSRDSAPLAIPVIIQIAGLPQVNHRLSRWESMVAYYAAGGIRSLYEHGGTDNELLEIPFKDRRMRGFALVDEQRAASLLNNFAEQPAVVDGDASEGERVHKIYSFAGVYGELSNFISAGVEAAILDAMFFRHRDKEDFTVVFSSLTHDDKINAFRAFTNQKETLLDAKNTFGARGFSLRSGKDERTGLHSLFGSGIRVSEMPVAVNAKDVAEYFGYALIRSLKELV